jgi:hypothetical protein
MTKKSSLIIVVSGILVALFFMYILNIQEPNHKIEDTKLEFKLATGSRTPLVVPEIYKICKESGLLAEYFNISPEYWRKPDNKILEGYNKLETAGVFNILEQSITTKSVRDVSNFTAQDYVSGIHALKALFYFSKVGILEKIKNGKQKEAGKQIDILTLVALEYPTGTFIGDREIFINTCKYLLREQLMSCRDDKRSN